MTMLMAYSKTNTRLIIEAHETAKACAKKLKICEVEMITALQDVDRLKVFRRYGAKSLFQYTVHILGLSEARAYDYICVARKTIQVTSLKDALTQNKITVSKARRLAAVITNKNANQWIDLAAMSSQRNLEREIAKVNPDSAQVSEGSRWVSKSRLEFRAKIDEKTDVLIRRVQDLECQRQKRAVTFGEALEILAKEYLRAHDPVEKAAKNLARARQKAKEAEPGVSHVEPLKRTAIPMVVQHKVNWRDQAKCQAPDLDGNPCEDGRWLHFHHIKPVHRGGTHDVDNLTTLCSGHHMMMHGY
mgnify:CR=1 FL=1